VLAKTRFALHAGLAFGAFHRYVYKPFRDGAFSSGVQGRLVAMAKAGAAALFVFHELKVAKADAEADSTLCHLVAPLDSLGAKLSTMGDRLKHGDANTSDLEGANTDVAKLTQNAQSSGTSIRETVPPAATVGS
jgi:hypothetical protein